eukprot:UN32008
MVEVPIVEDQHHQDDHGHHAVDKKLVVTIMMFQVMIFVFFLLAADYEDASSTDEHAGEGTVSKYYAMYQDVHVMIFIGFGFLMTFLRKHNFNSLGMNFLIGVFSILIGIMFFTIVDHWFEGEKVHVHLDIPTLIRGDFAAGAVLITFGAVLGRVTPTQILWMLFFELIFYVCNEYIGVHKFEAVDMGGSMFVHTFGAYFGLAFSWMLGVPKSNEKEEEKSVYHSDMFAMIGTIFLWMFWPSFNGALAGENFNQQERVVINTVLALCCSCSSAYLWSHIYEGRFEMVHIQNASLAGGVAIGSSSDLVVGPFSAILVGLIAGFVSTFGYVKITPRLNRWVYDVCGVHNLHGMPGIMGGIAGAISAATATKDQYGENIEEIFHARSHRTASEQGAFQAAALGCTLLFAIGGGLISGFIVLRIDDTSKENKFSDIDEWNVPMEETPFFFGTEKHEAEMENVRVEHVRRLSGTGV